MVKSALLKQRYIGNSLFSAYGLGPQSGGGYASRFLLLARDSSSGKPFGSPLARSSVLVQDLGHGAAGDVGALLGEAGVGQIATGVLAVGHVDVGDDVHDAAVGLLGQALVLAAVARLHVEDGDVQALGTNDAEAAVGIAQDEDGIGPRLDHQLVALGNDIAHGLAKVVAHSLHIHIRIGQLQLPILFKLCHYIVLNKYSKIGDCSILHVYRFFISQLSA